MMRYLQDKNDGDDEFEDEKEGDEEEEQTDDNKSEEVDVDGADSSGIEIDEKFPLKSFFFYVVYFVTFLSCVFRSAQYKNFDRFAVND